MRQWYTVKVKYTKEVQKSNGDDTLKKVNEPYLIPAVSFTDAEARVNKEVGESAKGDFLVHAMSVTNVMDVFRFDDCDQWHMCKITITHEDDNGKLTTEKQNYMVESSSVSQANKRLAEKLSDAMFDFRITKVEESNVVDVFHPDLDVEISRTTVE